jgi:DNA-binding response OmpR family regulator
MNALYADDDPIVRALLHAVLERLGYSAEAVADGDEAWTRFQALRPPLVLLDIDMPALTGLEVCKLIRDCDPQRETFILVLTGRDTEDDLTAVLDAGADDYVTKPATPENLLARVMIAERRIKQERARREAEAEVRRSRWLAGIGETTITLQHEINNPLAALLGHAELMMMDASKGGETSEQAKIIHEQAKRIANVVKRLGELRDPKSVEYIAGSRMIDLSREE